MAMSHRVPTGKITREPYASRRVCANGHPWTTENTRWRKRTRDGRTWIERDCLTCKHVSEGKRRRKTVRDRRYL